MTTYTSSQHFNTPAVSITSPMDGAWQPFPNYAAGLHLQTQLPTYPPLTYEHSDPSHSPLSSHVENESHSSSEHNAAELSPQSINPRPRRSLSQDSRDSRHSYENVSPSSFSINSSYVNVGRSEGYASGSEMEYVNVHQNPSRAHSPLMEEFPIPKQEFPSSPDSDSSFQSAQSTKDKQKRATRKGKGSMSSTYVEFPTNNHLITIKQVQASRIEKKPVGGRIKGQKLPEEIAANARQMRKIGSCWNCLFMRETVSSTIILPIMC
jgi:hypothetical protein